MKRSMSGKALAVLVAVVLLIGCAVGGTVAWLVAKGGTTENTFTVGNIKVSLYETSRTYHIVPGVNIAKDPRALVEADSEDCYLFVKVEEKNWPTFTEQDGTRKVDYKLAEGWTELEQEPGVYYRTVNKSDANQDFPILKGDQVTVSKNLTKVELDKVSTQPKLTFTVYAVQKEGVNSASDAWNLAQGNN